MSEKPRFGNLQSEENEYFSGSIVESMGNERADVQPALKKSSSHNEESWSVESSTQPSPLPLASLCHPIFLCSYAAMRSRTMEQPRSSRGRSNRIKCVLLIHG